MIKKISLEVKIKSFLSSLILIFITASFSNLLACGPNTQGGNRWCPALEIEDGSRNPCIGSVETYDINYWKQGCVKYVVTGGVVTHEGGVPITPTTEYNNCVSPSYAQTGKDIFPPITIKWGYGTNGQPISPPPTWGNLYVKGYALGTILLDCRDKETSFSFNFPSTPVSSIPQITGEQSPSCGNATLVYSIPWVSNDAVYTWTLPSGWISYNSPLSGRYLNSISVRPNLNSNMVVNGGYVTVRVDQPCGPTHIRSLPITGTTPLTVNISAPMNICVGTTVNLIPQVTGGVPPYTYQWSSDYVPLSCTTCSNPTMTPTSVPYSGSTRLNLNVTDSRGCSLSGPDYYINVGTSSGWAGGILTGEFLKTTLSGSNLVTDNSGILYFTGSDGKIYYYYFDTLQNKWLLSSSIAEGSLGSLAMDQSVPGQKTLYFKGSGQNLYKITHNGTAWGSSSIVGFLPQVQGNITVDQTNGLVFYRDVNNNLVKSSGGISSQIANQVAGNSFVLYNNNVFYFNNSNGNNHLYYTDYNGSFHASIAGAASPNSSLAADNSGNIFYADWNNIFRVPNNSGVYGSPVNITNYNPSTNGMFSINPSTGTIYYQTFDANIYQAYWNGSAWTTNLTASYYHRYGNSLLSTQPTGYLTFRNPHVFYIDASNTISNLYFFPGCNPSQMRKAAENSDHLPASSPSYIVSDKAFTCFPNPFGESTNISYEVDEICAVKISVKNTVGNEVRTLVEDNNHSSGSFNLILNASELPAGIYLCSFMKNGIVVKTNKLIVQN